jgi:hypothetical protein
MSPASSTMLAVRMAKIASNLDAPARQELAKARGRGQATQRTGTGVARAGKHD